MADYQLRAGRRGHHMALVMVALMFLARNAWLHRETADLLSCNDLVEIMRHKLPRKIETDADWSRPRYRHRQRQPRQEFRL